MGFWLHDIINGLAADFGSISSSRVTDTKSASHWGSSGALLHNELSHSLFTNAFFAFLNGRLFYGCFLSSFAHRFLILFLSVSFMVDFILLLLSTH
jgi:hypothetical protein